MPDFTFTSPDGKNYTVSGPEGATPEQAFAMLQQHIGGAAAPKQTADEAMASPEGQKLAGELRNKADKMLLEAAGAESPVYAGLSSAANTAGLNVPRNIKAGIMSLQSGKPFSQEYDYLKNVDEAAARQSPWASGVGTAVGIGSQIAALPISAPRTLGGAALQGAGVGGGLSGAAEFIDTKDPSLAARAAASGAAVGLPLGAAGHAIASRLAAPTAEPIATDVAQAAGRLGIDVPRAVASDSMAVQRLGNVVRNVPLAGDPLVKGAERAIGGLQGAVRETAAGYGAGGSSGPNVANRIGGTLRGLADQEVLANSEAAKRATEAARGAATAQDEMAAGVSSGALEAQRGRVLGRIDTLEGNARELARREFGQMTPQQVGETITTRLRTAEGEARNLKNELYGIAGGTDATINADAVRGVAGRVAGALDDAGRVIDPVLTPASARMMERLQTLSRLEIPNRVGTATAPRGTVGVDFAGIEQTRKVLNGLSRAASNDADRSAARMITRQFDNWVTDSFDRALYSGSDEALTAIQAARTANRNWRENFGFNSNVDADRIVNRIATGEVTPQETANWIIGAAKVGASGSSARLLQRIATATGNDPEAAAAIRSGIWNRLSQNAEGVERGTPEQIANGIFEFLNGSGQPVSRAMFDGRQRRIMEVYAQTIREGARGRQALERGARPVRTETTRVADVRPDVGPMEELANTVLGRNGKTDEALFATIEAYSRSGSRGDLKTLGHLLDVIPHEQRGDLASAIIGKMGASPRAANEFSGDVFLSSWRTMTPQAKAMLFGMSGNLRQSLDDIAAVSQRFKEMNKFANPSGTAQNVTGAMGITGLFSSPITTVAAIIGARATAKVLAQPATASSLAKWSRAYEIAVRKPTAATGVALTTASRNLSGTIAKTTGVSVDPAAIMRGITNQAPTRADDENTGQVPAIRRQ